MPSNNCENYNKCPGSDKNNDTSGEATSLLLNNSLTNSTNNDQQGNYQGYNGSLERDIDALGIVGSSEAVGGANIPNNVNIGLANNLTPSSKEVSYSQRGFIIYRFLLSYNLRSLFHWLNIISDNRCRQGMNLHYRYMRIAPYLIVVQRVHPSHHYPIEILGCKVQLQNKIP